MQNTAPTAAARAGQPAHAQNRALSAAMAAQFAGESGESYVPRAHWGSSYLNYAIDGKPLFTWMDIDRMSNDPQIILGMLILRAPIYQAKWKIEGDPKQAEYVDSILKRFWRTSLINILTFYEWGVAVGGIKHRRDKANPGKYEFDRLIPFAPHDCKPLVFNEGKRKGKLAGIHVESNETTGTNPTAGGQFNLYSPKAFWFKGYSKYGELYGRPRLAGAHQPFLEKNGRHGAVDSRRLWFHKNAFSGPTVKHPLGVVNLGSDESPSIRSNESYAREIGEKAANGHVMTLPSINGPDGKPLWDFVPGQSFSEVAGLREYPKDLDEEMFTGLGIPMELVKAAAVGSGYSGRSIPAQMFFTSMDETVVAIIDAVDEMIVKPLVRHRFGVGNENYEIMPQSLAEEVAKQDPNAGGGDGRARDASGHFIPKGAQGADGGASGMGGEAGQPATPGASPGNPPMGAAGKAMMGKLGLSEEGGDTRANDDADQLTADELDVLQRVKELAAAKWPVGMSVDASGHDHKGKGPGGGQFIGKTSKGKDGSLETHHDEAAGKKVVADKGKAIKHGLERARHFTDVANGMVPIPLLLREAQRADPSLTLAELHDGLQTLWKGRKLQMQPHNEVHQLKPEEQVGIHTKQGGYYHYVLDQSGETRKKEDWDKDSKALPEPKGEGSTAERQPAKAKSSEGSPKDALPPDVFASAFDRARSFIDAPKGGASIGTMASTLRQRGHADIEKLKASILAAEAAGKVELIEHNGEAYTIPDRNAAIFRDDKWYTAFKKKDGVELSAAGDEAGHPPTPPHVSAGDASDEHDDYDSTDDVHASAYAYFLSKAADLAETDPDKLQEIADVIGELIENPDYLDSHEHDEHSHAGSHSSAGAGGQPAVGLAWEDYGTSRSGKHRWRDSETRRVRYQERRPGERKEKQGEATAALQKIEAELQTGEITREHVATILQHAEYLRKDQVSRLATHLQNSYGAKGIGGQGEGAGRIGLGRAKKEMVGRIDAYVTKVLAGHEREVPDRSPLHGSDAFPKAKSGPDDDVVLAAAVQKYGIGIPETPVGKKKLLELVRGLPNLSQADKEIEEKARGRVLTQFADLRAAYLKATATPEKDGNGYRSIVLNTDDWRDLFDGYTGSNASAVHEPSSYANYQMYNEAVKMQAGKLNGQMLVLAGGGGSGKGTAVRDFFDQNDYPLVIDQVSDNYKKLVAKMDEAKAQGFQPAYVLVDRRPEDAFGGVVGRALALRRDGKPARTVDVHTSVDGNIKARKTALELLKSRPDVAARIIDNTGRGERELITDRDEAIKYLTARIEEEEGTPQEELVARMTQGVLARHAAGEIPADIAEGIVGSKAFELHKNSAKIAVPEEEKNNDGSRVSEPGAVPPDEQQKAESGGPASDRLGELRRSETDGGVQGTNERKIESSIRGAQDQTGRLPEEEQLKLDGYVSAAMGNLKKTSRTAGGVVDTSASAGKADQIAEGLTGNDAAKFATQNFQVAVKKVFEAATQSHMIETGRDAKNFIDHINRVVNRGIVKEGVLYRTDDSTKYPYTKIENLKAAHRQFSEELASRLNDPNANPVETAAWIEWRANLTDHFWADGCGKTAKALAMIPLMRAGLPLPEYPDNKTFFAQSGREAYTPDETGETYLDQNWDRFKNFYKTLMPAGATAATAAGDSNASTMETASGTSEARGIYSGRELGADAQTARTGTLPGDGEGTSVNGELQRLPSGENGERSGSLLDDAAKRQQPSDGTADGAGATADATGERTGGEGRSGRGSTSSGGGGTAHVQISDPTPAEQSLSEPATPENPTDVKASGNYAYSSKDFAYGAPKQKFAWNIEAIKLLRQMQEEGRTTATPAEQAVLAKFIGWGQFGQMFDYEDMGQAAKTGDRWEEERAELKSLLGPDGYAEARASTTNSHYTDPSIVDAHWQIAQKLGFKSGHFLETSAGIGYYLGMMPPELRDKVRVTAVEKDSGPGAMLQYLYPKSDVRIGGIEEQSLTKNFYDLVASNVPFGDVTVYDPDHNHMKAPIHDYFFLKSVDHVKPGGIIQHITSLWTLDKLDPKIRQKLAETCDLVSAIRFPNEAHKGGAGTSVATDMIILRKRKPGELPGDQSWLETKQIPDPLGGDPITVNKYFADNPDQVLGRIDRSGKMRAKDTVGVSRTDDYDARLKAAIDRLPSDIMTTKSPREPFLGGSQPRPGSGGKIGSYSVKDGKVHITTPEGPAEVVGIEPKQAALIADHVKLLDAVRSVINTQLEGGDAKLPREALHKAYDEFVKKNGFVNDPKNVKAFASDPESSRVTSIEKWDPYAKNSKGKKGVGTKEDIFEKDVVKPWTLATKAQNATDALGISLHETGGINIERMSEITGIHSSKIEAELEEKGLAFHDPQHGWKPKDQYLSGYVREKLAAAQAAAKNDPRYQKNVEALLKAQPKDVPFTEITAKMGVSWVPAEDMAKFAAELLGGHPDDFEISQDPISGKWRTVYTARGKKKHGGSKTANEVWGTFSTADREETGYNKPTKYKGDHGRDFMDLFSSALNSGVTTVTKWEYDSNNKLVEKKDPIATEAAMVKIQEMKEKFADWVWQDQERRDRIHRYYNDTMNNVVRIQHNGQHLSLPGMNPSFTPHPHIKDFVWQMIVNGRGIAGHEVGMGKTTAMVATAMELRRLGLARKPAIACLKSNIESITEEARQLYPGANILSTAGHYSAKARKAILAKIAAGDYDLVIMTHDHIDKMKMSKKTQKEFINSEMKELVEMLQKVSINDEDGKKSPTTKAIEKAIERAEVRMKAALDESDKDDNIKFEETGIDHLMVDEAHYYKTLPNYSTLGQVKGVNTNASDKATEMLMRTQWLLKKNGGRGVVFATGTPVTNTMGELYNLQKFIQPDTLKKAGLNNFDDWAKTFGDVVTNDEMTVSGDVKPVSRFAKFVNLPELKQMAFQDLDVRRVAGSAAEKTIHRPEMKIQAFPVPPTEQLLDYVKDINERAKKIALRGRRPPEPGDDNMLNLSTDGKKASIDMRLVDPEAEDHPDSKANAMVKNVLKLSKERPGSVQLIFSDLGVHPVGVEESNEEPVESADSDSPESWHAPDVIDTRAKNAKGETVKTFHLFQDVIDKLVAGGIPREKIANFGELEGQHREDAMEKLKRGEMVVALGSTKRLGTGVNVQNKIAAIHHLDVPDRPDFLEQRNGRGFRHGNENYKKALEKIQEKFPDAKSVADLVSTKEGREWWEKNGSALSLNVFNYVTEQSFDQMFWTRIASKDKFIKDCLNVNDMSTREVEEVDNESVSPDQMIAIATGDPRYMKRHKLDREFKQLDRERKVHEAEQLSMAQSIEKSEGELIERRIEGERTKAILAAAGETGDEEEKKKRTFAMTVGNTSYGKDDRDDAETAFKEAIASWEKRNEYTGYGRNAESTIGQWRGLDIKIDKHYENGRYRTRTYLEDPKGNPLEFKGSTLQSLTSAIADARRGAAKHDARVEMIQNELKSLKEKSGKEFPKLERHGKVKEALDDIRAELAAEEKGRRRANQDGADDGDGIPSDLVKVSPTRKADLETGTFRIALTEKERKAAVDEYAETLLQNQEAIEKERNPARYEKNINDDIREQYRVKHRKIAETIVDSINDPEALKNSLNKGHFHPDNKTTRKLFEAVTGITLPDGAKKTEQAINAYIARLKPVSLSLWGDAIDSRDELIAELLAESRRLTARIESLVK